jgi:SAM-dependent methyltransferase
VSRLARLRRGSRRAEPHPDLVRLTPEDRRYLTSLYDDSVPLPPGAEALTRDNPRLVELREAYAALASPVTEPSRWHDGAVEGFLDLRWFRGETLFVWHYRELPRITALKYFLFAQYVRERDPLGLLDRLEEDGAFGCWTFTYPGHGRYSRDLLESVNEIAFLERHLALAARQELAVLDVGAGYGRLAHRMTRALPNVRDYCCVDAVPESTFLSEWYLRHRSCTPPARVVALHELDEGLAGRRFDLAVNVHSWSECPLVAVEWWVERLAALGVPHLLVVPNEPDELLTLERDGSRRDFEPALTAAGFRRIVREPVVTDPAVRELVRLDDAFHLFSR